MTKTSRTALRTEVRNAYVEKIIEFFKNILDRILAIFS